MANPVGGGGGGGSLTPWEEVARVERQTNEDAGVSRKTNDKVIFEEGLSELEFLRQSSIETVCASYKSYGLLPCEPLVEAQYESALQIAPILSCFFELTRASKIEFAKKEVAGSFRQCLMVLFIRVGAHPPEGGAGAPLGLMAKMASWGMVGVPADPQFYDELRASFRRSDFLTHGLIEASVIDRLVDTITEGIAHHASLLNVSMQEILAFALPPAVKDGLRRWVENVEGVEIKEDTTLEEVLRRGLFLEMKRSESKEGFIALFQGIGKGLLSERDEVISPEAWKGAPQSRSLKILKLLNDLLDAYPYARQFPCRLVGVSPTGVPSLPMEERVSFFTQVVELYGVASKRTQEGLQLVAGSIFEVFQVGLRTESQRRGRGQIRGLAGPSVLRAHFEKREGVKEMTAFCKGHDKLTALIKTGFKRLEFASTLKQKHFFFQRFVSSLICKCDQMMKDFGDGGNSYKRSLANFPFHPSAKGRLTHTLTVEETKGISDSFFNVSKAIREILKEFRTISLEGDFETLPDDLSSLEFARLEAEFADEEREEVRVSAPPPPARPLQREESDEVEEGVATVTAVIAAPRAQTTKEGAILRFYAGELLGSLSAYVGELLPPLGLEEEVHRHLEEASISLELLLQSFSSASAKSLLLSLAVVLERVQKSRLAHIEGAPLTTHNLRELFQGAEVEAPLRCFIEENPKLLLEMRYFAHFSCKEVVSSGIQWIEMLQSKDASLSQKSRAVCRLVQVYKRVLREALEEEMPLELTQLLDFSAHRLLEGAYRPQEVTHTDERLAGIIANVERALANPPTFRGIKEGDPLIHLREILQYLRWMKEGLELAETVRSPKLAAWKGDLCLHLDKLFKHLLTMEGLLRGFGHNTFHALHLYRPILEEELRENGWTVEVWSFFEAINVSIGHHFFSCDHVLQEERRHLSTFARASAALPDDFELADKSVLRSGHEAERHIERLFREGIAIFERLLGNTLQEFFI